MKRTDTLTKLVSLLLFAALLAYLGIYIIRSISSDLRTAPAVYISLTESGSANGIFLRDEKLITSDEPYLSISATHGSLLAAGETIAVVYASQEALERAGRIKELEIQQKYISDVLNGKNSSSTLPEHERAVRNAVTALCAASARRDTAEIADASLDLSSLVMDSGKLHTTAADLELVTNELYTLRLSAANDTASISAQAPGLYSAGVDGYEQLSPDILDIVTPESLRELFDARTETANDVIGKLCAPYEWYFAAILAQEDAKKLDVGDWAKLDFGRYCSQPLSAMVTVKSAVTGGECAVVFRCTEASSELLPVRLASADVIFGSREGIRVPKEAVATDDKGAYVYTLTAMQAEKKYIEIQWEEEDYYLVAVSSDAASLRVGNEIILSSKELYDGKLMK